MDDNTSRLEATSAHLQEAADFLQRCDYITGFFPGAKKI